MAIEIRLIGSRICPYIVCDQCGKDITEPELAMAVNDAAQLVRDRRYPTLFAHKSCLNALEATRVKDLGTEELTVFLAQLLLNTGMDLDAVTEAIERATDRQSYTLG